MPPRMSTGERHVSNQPMPPGFEACPRHQPQAKVKVAAKEGEDRSLAPELCAACLFEAAVLQDTGTFIGSYELLQKIGEGGMGTVYVAKHADEEHLVALKIAKPDFVSSGEGVAAFRHEINTASALVHANIVRIYTSGTHQGRPFYVMQLFEGGTLADGETRARCSSPKQALAVVLKVVRAVQFAHERAVLHCDIKAANILLGPDDEPAIADFGLARAIEAGDLAVASTVVGGTAGWMSPEQVRGEGLTTASDVFSLGVLLYWLLMGELPFGAGADFEERVVGSDPSPPGQFLPGLEAELGAICTKALQKEPERRYGSAKELADDLERARDGLSTSLDHGNRRRRLAKWARRHRVAAAGAIELVLLLAYLALMPMSVFLEVNDSVREQNRFGAVAQAGAVMNELRLLARRVETMAQDPNIPPLIGHTELFQPPNELAPYARDFDFIWVFSADGVVRASWPRPQRYIDNTVDFAFRDYFIGQQRLVSTRAGGVYVSRAFRSYAAPQSVYLGLSAPLFDSSGRHVGAIVGATRARSTFGSVQMNCAGQGGCLTALLGPRDRQKVSETLPAIVNVLAQPGLADGEDKVVDAALSRRICQRFGCEPLPREQFVLHPNAEPLIIDDYEDPISHGQATAAVAPVGGTGLVVLVATPQSAVEAISDRMSGRVKAFLWLPIVLGLVILGLVLVGPSLRAGGRGE